MSTAENQFCTWVGRRASDITEDGGISHFTCFHDSGDGYERLGAHRSPSVDHEEEAADVAQILWDMAEKDASTRLGTNTERYVVIAYRDVGGTEEEDSQYSFTLHGRNRRLSAIGDSEPATEKGVLGQQMRVIGELHKLLADVNQSTNQQLTSENARLANRLKSEEEMRLKSFEIMQDLMDRKQDRDLNRAEAEQRAKRVDQVAEFALSMMPLMMAKFFGTSAGTFGNLPAGVGNAARDQSVAKVIKALSEDEVAKIAEHLEPPNRLAFFELYQSYATDLKKAEKEKPPELQDEAVTGKQPTTH